MLILTPCGQSPGIGTIFHVYGYIEDLETLFCQLEVVPVLKSVTNIAFIYNIILEEIIK